MNLQDAMNEAYRKINSPDLILDAQMLDGYQKIVKLDGTEIVFRHGKEVIEADEV